MNAPAALAALVLVMLLAAVPGASRTAPHGFYNTGPDGTSELAPDHVLHGSLDGLEPGDTLVVVGPSIAYDLEDVARIRAFLEAGGRLLVADDTGTGVGLLARLDAGVNLVRAPVYTPVFGDDDPRDVVVENQGFSGWPAETELRRARVVMGDGEPLLLSHPLSWLDKDDDGRPGLAEPRGSFAFAMRRAVGDGELLVVGSAGALDNGGHPLRDGLLSWAHQGRVVLDDGHRAAVDPAGAAGLLAGKTAWIPWLLPVAAAGVAIRTFQVRPVRVRARRARPMPPSPVLQELDP